MNTKKFRTKTEFIKRDNGMISPTWEIAIDIGYSAVKLFSPNIISRFPSYAKRVDQGFSYAAEPPVNSILYKNLDTNEMWLVGEEAQNNMDRGDTSDSEAILYSRDRYDSDIFHVISEVGLGIGLMDNEYRSYGGERIVVQTGLPEKYMSDEERIKESLEGAHHFAIKIGRGTWQEFGFHIVDNNIYVMSQPKGTLFSVCINKDGSWHPDAKKYLSSSILVFDPGFKTLDLFPIKNGQVGNGETYSDLGMMRVFQETTKMLREHTKGHVDVPVPAIQKYLEEGKVPYLNKKTFESEEYRLDDFLAKACNDICEEAIHRMVNAVDLTDYKYLIITGGTGAAWAHNIEEKFKKITTLQIIHGNQNDNLAFVFSNVRGYYLYRYNKLAKEVR